jgi:hypothetical protein
LSRSRVDTLESLAAVTGVVPDAVGVGSEGRREALRASVRAVGKTAERIGISAESVPLPAADFTRNANRLVEGDTRVEFAVVGDQTPLAGRIVGAVEDVTSARFAEAAAITPDTARLRFAIGLTASIHAASRVADTILFGVEGEHVTSNGVVDELAVVAGETRTNLFFRETQAVELRASAIGALTSCVGVELAMRVETANTLRQGLTRRSGQQVARLPSGHQYGDRIEGLAELIQDVAFECIHGNTQNGVDNGRIRELLESVDNLWRRFEGNTSSVNTTDSEVRSHGDVFVGKFGESNHDDDALTRRSVEHGSSERLDGVNDAVFFSRDARGSVVEIRRNFVEETSHATAVCTTCVLSVTDLDNTDTETRSSSSDSSGLRSVGKRSVENPFAKGFDNTSEGHALTTGREKRSDGTINHEDDVHIFATSEALVQTLACTVVPEAVSDRSFRASASSSVHGARSETALVVDGVPFAERISITSTLSKVLSARTFSTARRSDVVGPAASIISEAVSFSDLGWAARSDVTSRRTTSPVAERILCADG